MTPAFSGSLRELPQELTPCTKHILAVMLLLPALTLFSQNITQRVSGSVSDTYTGQPVGTAQVVLLRQGEVVQNTVTADKGRFVFENVEVGRYKLDVTHASYTPFSTEVFVQSAKETWLPISLTERVRQLDEVEVVAPGRTTSGTPGVQELSIEKATRMAANFFDPVRVTTSFPGVVVANDQNNAIIVRGNSPDGLLWRLNGLDILNPNHLSNAGTLSDRPASNGGGVNILSAQMLGATRFINGNYLPAYGNFQSAVVDMELRESHSNKIRHTAQASLIGLDYASEGPIVPDKLSYTFNARYSTVGLLTRMGVDFGGDEISFMDVAGQLAYRTRGNGVLKFFFMAGDSENNFEAKPQDEWQEDKDRFNIRYTGRTTIGGLSFTTPLQKDASLKTGIAYSVSNQTHFKDFTGNPQVVRYNDFSMKNRLLSQYVAYTKSLKPNTWLEIGNYINVYSTDLYKYQIPRPFDCLFCNIPNDGIDGTFDTWQLSTYAQIRRQFSEKWNALLGVRGVKTGMYNAYQAEPRAEIQYEINEKQLLSLNYSAFSRLQSVSIYLSELNEALEPTRSHHFSLNYSLATANDLMLRSSVYFQYLTHVPVEPGNTFSVLNMMELQERGGLVNDGVGSNYGVDLSVEKSFYDDFYFLTGGSIYRSQYLDDSGNWLNTRFDGRFTVNLAAGKEWNKQKKNARKSFGVDTRFLYLGGLNEMPILDFFSSLNGETVFNEAAGFSEKLPDYLRFDLRLSWRKHKPNYTRTISIDMQNVFNIKNTAYHYFDAYLQERVAQNQLGIIPILAYRVEF